jgi:hypothetical protein
MSATRPTSDRSVSPAEAVVLGGLLDPGRLDLERHPPHGREDRVDRDDADGVGGLVGLGRAVAPALGHRDVDGDAARLVERRQVQVAVEDLDVGGELDVLGADVGRAAHVEPQGHRLFAVADEDDVLEVEDDVGDVLDDTRDRVELVERVVEAHLRDGRTGDRREQGAPQRVAEGVAEPGVERPDREPLAVVLFVGDRLDRGALHDQHRGSLVADGWGVTTCCTARR